MNFLVLLQFSKSCNRSVSTGFTKKIHGFASSFSFLMKVSRVVQYLYVKRPQMACKWKWHQWHSDGNILVE